MDPSAGSIQASIGSTSNREFHTKAKSDEALSSSDRSRKRRAPSDGRLWDEYGVASSTLETSNEATISPQNDSGDSAAEIRGIELDREEKGLASRFGTGRRRGGYQPPSASSENVGGVVWRAGNGTGGIEGGVRGRGEGGERVCKIRKLDRSVTPLPLRSPNALHDQIRSPFLSPASSTFSPTPFSPFSFPKSPNRAATLSSRNASFDPKSVTPSRPHFSFLPFDKIDDLHHSTPVTTRIRTPIRTHFLFPTPPFVNSTSLHPIPDFDDSLRPSTDSRAGPTRNHPWQRTKISFPPLHRSVSSSTPPSPPSRHYSASNHSSKVDSSRREIQVGKAKVGRNPGGVGVSAISPLLRRASRPQFFSTATTPLTPTEILSLHRLNPHLPLSSSFPILPSTATATSASVLVPTSTLPPITRTSLKELDLAEILKNPALRHDVFHDEGLMFRANCEGHRYVYNLPRLLRELWLTVPFFLSQRRTKTTNDRSILARRRSRTRHRLSLHDFRLINERSARMHLRDEFDSSSSSSTFSNRSARRRITDDHPFVVTATGFEIAGRDECSRGRRENVGSDVYRICSRRFSTSLYFSERFDDAGTRYWRTGEIYWSDVEGSLCADEG